MTETVSKVRVYGKAQNRTILGIVNAYLVMYPQTTAEELDKAFPLRVTKKFAKNAEKQQAGDPFWKYGLFHEIVNKSGKRVWAHNGEEVVDNSFLFEQNDETLHTADGKELAMESTWPEDAFNEMINWAKQYGIEIASFEKAAGGAIKGGFRLEYLNGYVPPKPEKKTNKVLLAIVIALAIGVLGLLLWGLIGNKKGVVVEKEVIVHDTVIVEVVKEIKNIEKNFNAAKFVKGKSTLTEESKFVLHDLETLLKQNPQLKLKLVGHTSSEGDDKFNQKLSEERAKAAVDFLISRGIDKERLQYEGKGSSEPISNNQEENRRTEFVVIE